MAHGHIARLTALAVATGTLVAIGAAPAGAAVAPTTQMTATGTGSALTLTINLPAALSNTPLGTKIVQTISLTDGSVSTVTEPLAVSTAILGRGTTPVLSDLLNRSTAAVLTGEREQTSAAFSVDQPGLKLAILPLRSKVGDPMADGVLANSSSSVARVAVGGLGLPQLAAVTAPVAGVLETALGAGATGADAAGTVGATLNGAIDTLNGATRDAAAPVTAPVQQAIDQAVDTLTDTLAGLNDTIGSVTAATDVVTLNSVSSDQIITRKGSEVTSSVTNAVKDINVLNGLVKIAAVTSKATAVAGGKPGSASATTTAPILDISLANGALTAVLDEAGLNVGGTVGDNLPPALEGTVNGALNTVNGLLAKAIGLDVEIGKGATSVSPDGRSAAAAVSTTTVRINPPVIAELLVGKQDFIKLELVTANAAVGSQLVAAPAAPRAVPPSLPRTGGELPLSGALATLLVGAALLVRRRRAMV